MGRQSNKKTGVAFAVAVAVFAARTPGYAASSCVAKSTADGTIVISAQSVGANFKWGTVSGHETQSFTNIGTCVTGGTAVGCMVGAAGTLAAKTPPAGCTFFLRDNNGACTAWARKCSPGVRLRDTSFAAGDPRTTAVQEAAGPTIRFSGVNVQVVDGSGTTNGSTNGLGNLIVGYNEIDVDAVKTGSHNLVVGGYHGYSSFGGIVAGTGNVISGPYASVTSGLGNVASGYGALVSGGAVNTASGSNASVSGGFNNIASGSAASVSGGYANIASGTEASVSGGLGNVASSTGTSVSGGRGNTASDTAATVSGGVGNTASVAYGSVSGGRCNRAGTGANQTCASGTGAPSVSGGLDNVASGANAAIAGGDTNIASGTEASVSGGVYNTASGNNATVGGGASVTNAVVSTWHAGRASTSFPTAGLY